MEARFYLACFEAQLSSAQQGLNERERMEHTACITGDVNGAGDPKRSAGEFADSNHGPLKWSLISMLLFCVFMNGNENKTTSQMVFSKATYTVC